MPENMLPPYAWPVGIGGYKKESREPDGSRDMDMRLKAPHEGERVGPSPIRTLTVGPGISPGPPLLQGVAGSTAGRELHPAPKALFIH